MFTAVRVKPEVYRLVKNIAAREDRTQNAIIKRALEAYLREQRATQRAHEDAPGG